MVFERELVQCDVLTLLLITVTHGLSKKNVLVVCLAGADFKRKGQTDFCKYGVNIEAYG